MHRQMVDDVPEKVKLDQGRGDMLREGWAEWDSEWGELRMEWAEGQIKPGTGWVWWQQSLLNPNCFPRTDQPSWVNVDFGLYWEGQLPPGL